MLDLYKKWYIDRDCEQLDLFEIIAKQYKIKSVLYPGSFVHITPSFFIPYACYVDLDNKACSFFKDISSVENIVQKRAINKNLKPIIKFYSQDYTEPIPEREKSFDLLISQYAGFICEPCKKYLKPGGYLLVNNSHGDAGIANLDKDYTLVGVIKKSQSKHTISQKSLSDYFIPKKPEQNTKEHIQSIGKGIAYTKPATLYLFQFTLSTAS